MSDALSLGTEGNQIKLGIKGSGADLSSQLERLKEALADLHESQKQTA
jgi:hypothetical protein